MPNFDANFTRVNAVEVNAGDIALRAVDGVVVAPGLRLAGTDLTATGADLNLLSQTGNATNIGAVAEPASGTLTCAITRQGTFFSLTFTLTAVQIAVTDGAGSGSHGATKLFDFVAGSVSFLGCRQNYTSTLANAAITAAGDAVFEIGVGTTAISAAANGVLAAANDNVGADIDITHETSDGVGTGHTGAGGIFDGTTDAAALHLNWSGTAATVNASGTIDVTGTITVVGCFLGDD
ncbi:MAG: hypothetical protein AB7G11_02660 [Phycisphaerales bacterium]